MFLVSIEELIYYGLRWKKDIFILICSIFCAEYLLFYFMHFGEIQISFFKSLNTFVYLIWDPYLWVHGNVDQMSSCNECQVQKKQNHLPSLSIFFLLINASIHCRVLYVIGNKTTHIRRKSLHFFFNFLCSKTVSLDWYLQCPDWNKRNFY